MRRAPEAASLTSTPIDLHASRKWTVARHSACMQTALASTRLCLGALLLSVKASMRPLRRLQLRRARLQSQQALEVQRAQQLVHVRVLTAVGPLAVFARERRSVRAKAASACSTRAQQASARTALATRACADWTLGLAASTAPPRSGTRSRRPAAALRAQTPLAADGAARLRKQLAWQRAAEARQSADAGPSKVRCTHPERSAANPGHRQQQERRPRAAAAARAPSALAKRGHLQNSGGFASRAPHHRCAAASPLAESRP